MFFRPAILPLHTVFDVSVRCRPGPATPCGAHCIQHQLPCAAALALVTSSRDAAFALLTGIAPLLPQFTSFNPSRRLSLLLDDGTVDLSVGQSLTIAASPFPYVYHTL
jgi:hypothetical protein